MQVFRIMLCMALLVPASLQAQVLQRSDEIVAEELPSRWSLGLAAAVRESAYAGEDRRSLVIPNVTYEGERFYWHGGAVGYRLIKRDGFGLDGFIAARMDGIDAGDFGVRELAERGVDRARLEDRDDSADAGLSATWKGVAGELELDVRADITSASEGYQTAAHYRYPLRVGGAMITPSIGVESMSKDMADYYYGTLDEEIARGVVRYRPGSVVVPDIGVTLVKPFARKWLFIASVEYRALPDELKDSPLVEKDADSTTTLVIGVSRGF